MIPAVSVILCTRDPHPDRLARTLAGLMAQDLESSSWELLLVDNGSTPALSEKTLPPHPRLIRIIHEPTAGLTRARLAGISAAQGDVLVFVDDDNVLDRGYLSTAFTAFQGSLRLAAAGGPVRPEFAVTPPEWAAEFSPLLALCDHGPDALLATGGPDAGWPAFAPVGAGLCLRRTHALAYADIVRTNPEQAALDRRAGALVSGGDNDMVFTALRSGGDVAYIPALGLTHLIPPGRLDPAYLARLNLAIQRSWVRVLALHGKRPWSAIPRWTVPLRACRAWLRSRSWRGPTEKIRYHGLLGRLLGQSDLKGRP